MINPSDLSTLSAAESARRIARGFLSSEALVQASLDRAMTREPGLQAWSHLDAAIALGEAKRRDQEHLRGPLHGVPIAIKDLIDVEGMPTTNGSPIYRDNIPLADASCVALLRAAGAVVLGKTSTVEFGASHPTKTRNPRNPAHTPGGSSSGSAAVVADNQVALSLGTQTGGSVIRPAAFCGVIGFKASYGKLCLAGTKMCAWSLDTLGILGRNLEDIGLLFEVFSHEQQAPSAPTTIRLCIGLFLDPYKDEAQPCAQLALDKASAAMIADGMALSVIDAPSEFLLLKAAQRTIARFEMARSLAHEWNSKRNLLSESICREIEEGWAISHSEYASAKMHVALARRAVDVLFSGVDVLVTFAAPGEAPRGLASTGSVVFNGSWTALGLPCIALPVSTGPTGLPVGIQLVGPNGTDRRLIEIAVQVERALKRHIP